MLRFVPGSDPSATLLGLEVGSAHMPDVTYRLVQRLGKPGPSSIPFYAMRLSASGQTPVVFKMMRPNASLTDSGGALSVTKETLSLARLAERVPPTPFVVRLLDTGAIPAELAGVELTLPWLVVEYVYGGAEGTTLRERTTFALQQTGSAFEPLRAARAVECIAGGLSAVHELGIVHRDIQPDNVLATGFGDDEIFKIADFGIARLSGASQATFGPAIIATPGYVAPERLAADPNLVGTWTDVFGFASVVFHLLTGEEYLRAHSLPDAVRLAKQSTRRSILEAPALHPDLRRRDDACRAIDGALARASAPYPSDRTQRADQLAAELLPVLRGERMSVRPSAALRESFILEPEDAARRAWVALHEPSRDLVVRSAAWDGDARCLASTNRGLSFWDGTSWRDAPVAGLPDPEGIRFVRRVGPGRWLLGGDGAIIAQYTTAGVGQVSRGLDPAISIERLGGDLATLAVAVGTSAGAPPTLFALFRRQWLPPVVLHDAASVNGLARVDDDHWLIAGRGKDARAFAAIYNPVSGDWQRISTPPTRALLACAGDASARAGIAVGATGAIVSYERGSISVESTGSSADLSACAIDASGRAWVAAAGRLWAREPAHERASRAWTPMWQNEAWRAPIVSVHADIGRVIAVTADGALVEGRMPSRDGKS